MALLADDISINTVVGAGTKVSGDLNIAGLVRIDGDIDGNLETTGRIIIGEKARIHGNVTAKAAVIGGIGSLPGSVLGGFLIGILKEFAAVYGFGAWSDVIVYGIFVIILLFKPAGLLGKDIREKV